MWWLHVPLSESDFLIGLLIKVRNSLDSVQGEKNRDLGNDQILAVWKQKQKNHPQHFKQPLAFREIR